MPSTRLYKIVKIIKFLDCLSASLIKAILVIEPF
jgi:hypothetical protein